MTPIMLCLAVAAFVLAYPSLAVPCSMDSECTGLSSCYTGQCGPDGMCLTKAMNAICTPNPLFGDPLPVTRCARSACVAGDAPGDKKCGVINVPNCKLCSTASDCRPRLCSTHECSPHPPSKKGICVWSKPRATCCSPLDCRSKGDLCNPRACVYTTPVPFRTRFPLGTCELAPRPNPSPVECCFSDECEASGTKCTPKVCEMSTKPNYGSCVNAPVNPLCCTNDSECGDIDYDPCTADRCVIADGATKGTCIPDAHPLWDGVNGSDTQCCAGKYHCPASVNADNCQERICDMAVGMREGVCKYQADVPSKTPCTACKTSADCPQLKSSCKNVICAGPFSPIPYTCVVVFAGKNNLPCNELAPAAGICKSGVCTPVIAPAA